MEGRPTEVRVVRIKQSCLEVRRDRSLSNLSSIHERTEAGDMRKLAWGREWRGSRLLLLTLTPGGGKTDINVPILEIRKLRQALVQGYPAKKWPTNLRSHNQSLVELESFSFLGKNELFPLKSAFPFLSVSLIVVLLLSSGNNILHL